MGSAWSCCLPCAGGGGGGGGAAVSGATPEVKKGTALKQHQQPQQHQKGLQQCEQQQTCQQQDQQHQYQPPKRICVAQIKERAPLSDLDEDLDDDLDDDDDEEKEGELRIGDYEEDYCREGGTQHRLSPRLHDIEEEDDEEGRNVRERSVVIIQFRGFFDLVCAKRLDIEFIILSSRWRRRTKLLSAARRFSYQLVICRMIKIAACFNESIWQSIWQSNSTSAFKEDSS